MTEGDRDFLGQAYWRKRIYQIKKEFRSPPADDSRTIPEQPKAYGPDRKPKRVLHSRNLTRPKSAIASAPSHRVG